MPGRRLRFASRNKRELKAAEKAGFEIKVISSDDVAEFERDYPGYELIQDRVVKLNSSIPQIKRYFLILRNYFRSIRAVRNTDGDVISCHDIDSLCLCRIAQMFRQHKAKIIYDSHEFEIGRNKKRNRLQLWWITHLERFLIKRCTFSIMVNDQIADEVQKLHNLKERPVVVRSTPDLWLIDKEICDQRRKEFESEIGTGRFLLMYHGGVTKGRGIETLIDIIGKTENTAAILLGNGEEEYLKALKKRVVESGVSDRILFHAAVPIDVLWQYVGAADVGMVTIPAAAKSYYYMLPNKFFENIQSETPVICSAFPAIKPIVDKYNIGLTCDPSNMDEIIACIEKMCGDNDFYEQCKANLKIAKQEFCWENEEKKLFEAYRTL